MPVWPEWWDWDLELSSHLFKRMVDRDFNEVEMRRMYDAATAIRPDVVPGRWIVETTKRHSAWEIIVEPDTILQVVVVVTAYPIST